MRRINDPAPIDALLGDAEVLADDYDDYDVEVARRRLTASADHCCAPPDTPVLTSPFPSVHEQAAHDLSLAAALIVDAPQAASALARLVDADHVDPEGAVVFAALLQLAGHRDAAQFWWQFAAGGGNRTAAFCLYLVHQQRAEFKDASFWRGQCRRPPEPDAMTGVPRPPAPGASRPSPGPKAAPAREALRALLPQEVRDDLISQCRNGRRPTLPARLEAAINSLPVDCADEDLGEIPRPVDGLAETLPDVG